MNRNFTTIVIAAAASFAATIAAKKFIEDRESRRTIKGAAHKVKGDLVEKFMNMYEEEKRWW